MKMPSDPTNTPCQVRGDRLSCSYYYISIHTGRSEIKCMLCILSLLDLLCFHCCSSTTTCELISLSFIFFAASRTDEAAFIVSTLLVIKSATVAVLTGRRSIYLHLKIGKTSFHVSVAISQVECQL